MLEHFVIFTKSGFILWKYEPATLHGNPVNALIKTVLLEERSGLDSFSFEAKYNLKWTLANECNLVFVAVYQKILQLTYIDDLLDAAKKSFLSTYGADVKPFTRSYSFEKQFENLLKEMQSRTIKSSESKELKKPATFDQSGKMKKLRAAGRVIETKKVKNPEPEETISDTEPEAPTTPTTPPQANNNDTDGGVAAGAGVVKPGSPGGKLKLPSKFAPVTTGPAGRKGKKVKPVGKKTDDTPEPPPGTKRAKGKRNWDPNGDTTPLKDLNFSVNPDTTAVDQNVSDDDLGINEKVDLNPSYESESSSEEDETPQAAPKKSGLLQYFTKIINRELTEADLQPVMAQFSNHLIVKNVASEIAEKLCASVTQNLVGKQLGTFDRVSKTVSEAMETALVRILTPKRQIDVLRSARAAKEQNRPYVIVFVGVNGVGKSTSLAKVCSWLLQNDLKVLMAACDTFRAGAIEQLQVHAKKLGVNVYHRGYGKDPAAVASEAINKARKEKTDVVLIDTAGRMQDNEPLMTALAKLVGVNEPDLVLFVGEALVGNEAVDQLSKFNRSLEDYGTGSNPRGIDGVFLTKFDTVDEKVGAAISMVYTTGQPIVFVGVGQKYSDIRQLNVQRVVSVLLKGH